MKKLLIASAPFLVGLALVVGAISIPAQMPAQDKVAAPPKLTEPPKVVIGDRDELVLQNQRYLKVKNDTASTLTVSLQYRTLVGGTFTWLPGAPPASDKVVSFEIQAGDEQQLTIGDEPLQASRARIWAVGDAAKWLTYKNSDLWLVPEKNDAGEHIYTAESVENFTLTFASKKGDIEDGDVNSAVVFPDEDVAPVPPPPPPDVRDLAVLPVQVSGRNLVLRVINKGRASDNAGRRLFVRRVATGTTPMDMGLIGPLANNEVRVFYLLGLPSGQHVAYLSPGDEPPFADNDERLFNVGAASFVDLRLLPVKLNGGNVTVRVKNVGTLDYPGGGVVRIAKIAPRATTIEVGRIGALTVNAVHEFRAVTLPAGDYRASISPGDPAPHDDNDSVRFAMGGIVPPMLVDLAVQNVTLAGNKATIRVKNVGLAPLLGGRHLKVVKAMPGARPTDLGEIGALMPGSTRTFGPVTLSNGLYRAFIDPGDPASHAGNDWKGFTVK